VRVLGVNCSNMAAYAIAAGELDDAVAYAREALVHLRDMEDLGAFPLEHIAVVDGLQGRVARAARVLGYTDQVMRRLGIQRGPTESAGFERLQAVLAAKTDDGELHRRLVLGAQMTRQEAIDLALRGDGAPGVPEPRASTG